MFRLTLFTAMAMLLVAPAHAAETRKFDRSAFAAAQAQGRPILVEVKAWWCPVCASQDRTIKAATAAPHYRDLVIFEINYDKQKAEWKAFAVTKQSTMIAFRGKNELGRLVGTTDKAQIGTLLAKTIG